MKKILVWGATGGIVSRAVKLLLQNSQVDEVRIIIRTPAKLPSTIRDNPKLKIITAHSLLDVSIDEKVEHLEGIDAVIFSLGHTMSFQGIFFTPLVVLEACKLLCGAILKSNKPCKIIEVNTIGIEKPDGTEIKRSLANNMVIGILKMLLPPFKGSALQAQYMFSEIGRENKLIEWVLVRPDGLQNEEVVTEYTLHESIPWTIFKPLHTSRINVAHFMCQLALDEDLFNAWKGKFPIILNKTNKISHRPQ
ncbi:SDR family oxidoreductase [soil metagenome]